MRSDERVDRPAGRILERVGALRCSLDGRQPHPTVDGEARQHVEHDARAGPVVEPDAGPVAGERSSRVSVAVVGGVSLTPGPTNP